MPLIEHLLTSLYTEIVNYLYETYYRDHHREFCKAWTNLYTNYGITASSFVESSHAQLRTYIDNVLCDIFELFKKIESVAISKEATYNNKVAYESVNNKHKYQVVGLLTNVVQRVSFKALNLTYTQYLYAKKRHLDQLGAGNGTCVNRYRHQFGLPCWHELYERLEVFQPEFGRNLKIRLRSPDAALRVTDFDSHWHLQDERVSGGALCTHFGCFANQE